MSPKSSFARGFLPRINTRKLLAEHTEHKDEPTHLAEIFPPVCLMPEAEGTALPTTLEQLAATRSIARRTVLELPSRGQRDPHRGRRAGKPALLNAG